MEEYLPTYFTPHGTYSLHMVNQLHVSLSSICLHVSLSSICWSNVFKTYSECNPYLYSLNCSLFSLLYSDNIICNKYMINYLYPGSICLLLLS